MKPSINPRERLYQIKVLQYSGDNNNNVNPFFKFNKDGKVVAMIDRHASVPTRTLFKHSKNNRAAIRYGSRFGTVVSCNKVDETAYLINIEHLVLKQEPIIEIDTGGVSIDRDLKVRREKKRKKKYTIEG